MLVANVALCKLEILLESINLKGFVFLNESLKLGARFECLQMQISFAFSLLFVRGFRDICHLQRNSALM